VPLRVQYFRYFQSHCGAIGTHLETDLSDQALQLSIPLWCDWDHSQRYRSCCRSGLSIPLWCDWDGLHASALLSLSRSSFNPTVVRLGPCEAHQQPRQHLLSFNPTVVRLGPRLPSHRSLSLSHFQSHCGAIGTRGRDVVLEFESPPFNPTVVRLGHGAGVEALGAVIGFQSHCGAIGTCPVAPLLGQPVPLSIPLWCDWDTISWRSSSMLMKLSIPLWCDWDGPDEAGRRERPTTFNPTVVRLGPEDLAALPPLPDAFNPTVVRLGPGHARLRIVPSPHFQSHCGAIGTHAYQDIDESDDVFQSHCGAIGTWSDASIWLSGWALSIPLWCDWDARGPCAPAFNPTAFNPTVVRLGRSRHIQVSRVWATFNPTVVRLGPGATPLSG